MHGENSVSDPNRRGFLKAAGTAAIGLAASGAGLRAAAQRPRVRMGVDAFSLGAQNWTPFQTLDWAAKMNVHMVHFSEVRFLGSANWKEALAPDNLKRIRDRAAELEIDLEIGMRSICPTAADFLNAQNNDPTLGTADEQTQGGVDGRTAQYNPPPHRCIGAARLAEPDLAPARGHTYRDDGIQTDG